jgi:nicotinamide-nucleotide amidase
MRYLLDKFVLPEILTLYKTLPVMRQRILKLYGLNEPSIAEILKELQGKTGGIILVARTSPLLQKNWAGLKRR